MILVTGSAGLIGSEVVRLLSRAAVPARARPRPQPGTEAAGHHLGKWSQIGGSQKGARFQVQRESAHWASNLVIPHSPLLWQVGFSQYASISLWASVSNAAFISRLT